MNFFKENVNNYRKMLKKKALLEFLQMIECPRQRGGLQHSAYCARLFT